MGIEYLHKILNIAAKRYQDPRACHICLKQTYLQKLIRKDIRNTHNFWYIHGTFMQKSEKLN